MTRDHLTALLEAFFVTFLWSSSYILVKVGLQQLTPLSLVALRYLTATVVLAIIVFRRGEMAFTLDRRNLVKMGVLGVSGYTIAQGLQCIGLFYLPAVSVTFILNFTPVIVLVLGVLVLGESPRPLQLAGMGLVLLGAYLYFNRPLSSFNVVGVLITLVSGLGGIPGSQPLPVPK